MEEDNGLERAWGERMEERSNGSPQKGSPQNGSPQKGSPSNGSPQGAEGAVAQGGVPEQKGRFPTTVTFRQDSDKTKVYLIMSFRGLTTSSGIFGWGRKLENGEILNRADVFQSNEVHLQLRVDNDNGTSTLFEYRKPVPKKIVPAKSEIDIEGNGKIKLTLKKVKGDLSDWTIYKDDFSHPNGS